MFKFFFKNKNVRRYRGSGRDPRFINNQSIRINTRFNTFSNMYIHIFLYKNKYVHIFFSKNKTVAGVVDQAEGPAHFNCGPLHLHHRRQVPGE